MTNIKFWLLSAFCVYLLSGCASGMAPITITEDNLNKAGEVVSTTTTTFSNNQVANTATINKGLQTYVKEYGETVRTGLVTIKKELVNKVVALKGTIGEQEVNLEMTIPDEVITEITLREPWHFDQKMPTEPPTHPGWAATIKGLDILTKGVVGGVLGYKGLDVLGSVLEKDTYSNISGDVFANKGDLTYSPGASDAVLTKFLETFGGE